MRDADDDAITDTIASGATGTLLTVKHFLPLLRASAGADVVNMVSSAAEARNHRSQAHPAFYAAKAAQAGFAGILSHRLRPEGIRVISLYPPDFTDGDPLHSTWDHTSRAAGGPLTAQSVLDCVLFAIGQPRDCFIRSFHFEQMQAPAQSVRGERPTASGSAQYDEHAVVVDCRTLLVKVVAGRSEELCGDRYQPLVPALALADEDPTLARRQVAQPQAEHLPAAQSAQQHRENHGPVPPGVQSAKHLFDLARPENAREGTGCAQQRRPSIVASTAVGQPGRHRIAFDGEVIAGRQVAEQAGDAGEPTLDGPCREAHFAVLGSDGLRLSPWLLLRCDEREDVRSDDFGRLLGHYRDEDLQVIGGGQQRVRPQRAATNSRQSSTRACPVMPRGSLRCRRVVPILAARPSALLDGSDHPDREHVIAEELSALDPL